MKSINSRLDAHPDFESNIKNNQITLINAIHNIMNETVLAHKTLV